MRIYGLFLSLVCAGAALAQSGTFADRDPRYRLQPTDVVEVHYRYTPEFDQTVVIQPDGFVNLRGIPDVRLEGKTTPEVVELLKTAYTKILHDPVISVELKEFEKPYFIATGEVGKPGKYDLRGDTTIAQAVAMAGGFTEKSKHSQVLLFRRVSNAWAEAKQFDMKQMLGSGNLTEDPMLHPGDMVFVPKNTISKIQRFIPIPSMGMYLNNW